MLSPSPTGSGRKGRDGYGRALQFKYPVGIATGVAHAECSETRH